jgi:hypothetical protein
LLIVTQHLKQGKTNENTFAVATDLRRVLFYAALPAAQTRHFYMNAGRLPGGGKQNLAQRRTSFGHVTHIR